MNNNRIQIVITGSDKDNGLVTLYDLASELVNLRNILKYLDQLISRSDRASMYFRITNLRYTSPAFLEIESVPIKASVNYSIVVVDRFLSGLKEIKSGSLPPDFDREIIDYYRALASPLKGNITAKVYKSEDVYVQLTEDLDTQIRNILGRDEFTQGFLSGILELINIHAGANRFRIYPIAGPKRIDCHFPSPLLGKAIEGLGKYVNINGRITYKSKEHFPYAIEVEDIEIFPEESELPTMLDIRGIAPQATGNLSSEDFVRRIRDIE
jgi:hypothetical protein